MNEKLKKLVAVAIKAPSGENCQPWRFSIKETTIEIFNDPESDISLYNYKQRGSLISHGAALENIILEASTLGLNLDTKYFPDLENNNHIATIRASEKETQPNLLAEAISQRTTNRKKYIKIKISQSQIDEIKNSAREIGIGEIKLLTDNSAIQTIARSLSMNEKIIFQNKYLHNFFYKHIRWTEEEDRRDSTGFFVKTLELSDNQYKGFRIFKNWLTLKFLDKIMGVSRLIAKDNEDNYSSASAIGIIVFKKNTQLDYVLAGRVFERIWLKITKMRLSMQPTTGVLFLMGRILEDELGYLTKTQIETIKSAYSNIASTFNVSQGTIMMLFRIGNAENPSAKSSRKEIQSFII